MSDIPIADDIALRIALAARTLPDVHVSRLLQVLKEVIGLPFTAERFAKLQVKDLKQAADGEFADLDQSVLKNAVLILKGDVQVEFDPPPPVEDWSSDLMGDSIRVACASDSGENLDGHFGTARRFLIYQVSATDVRLIDVRAVDIVEMDQDKNAQRAGLIADCQILYVASIGGPAAAKVIKRGIHPIKDDRGGNARDRMIALQKILAINAPPWLAKVMGLAPEARVRFALEEAGI